MFRQLMICDSSWKIKGAEKTDKDWANKEKEEIGKRFRNIFKLEITLPI